MEIFVGFTKCIKSSYKVTSFKMFYFKFQFSSVQLLSRVQLFVTPWTTACQDSLSITNSQSSPKPMPTESVMPFNHLILCRPLLLPPSIFLSIRVFSNESALHIRCPKYWSFSFSISPSSEHPGLISFRMDWLDLLAVQGTLKSLLQHHSSKALLLQRSVCFMVQLSFLTIAVTLSLTWVPWFSVHLFRPLPVVWKMGSLKPLCLLCVSFGMVHDGEGNPCRKTEGNIMSPTLTGNNGVFSWSSCSRQYLKKFLRWEDRLGPRAFPGSEEWPWMVLSRREDRHLVGWWWGWYWRDCCWENTKGLMLRVLHRTPQQSSQRSWYSLILELRKLRLRAVIVLLKVYSW